MHVWIWYPNPAGVYASMNPLVDAFGWRCVDPHQDLEDFAVGFSLTEGVISSVDAIESVEVVEDDIGITDSVTINGPGASALTVSSNHRGSVFDIAASTIHSASDTLWRFRTSRNRCGSVL